VKPIRFRYLLHGTSSKHRAHIESNGLLPVNGKLHLTTNPAIAFDEAENTVKGEPHLIHGYKIGIGGDPLIVKVERGKVWNLRLDSPGYYDKESASIRRLVPKRFAFTTDALIRPEHLAFIDSDFEAECHRLTVEIHRMARLLPFQYRPEIEEAFLAERLRENTDRQ